MSWPLSRRDKLKIINAPTDTDVELVGIGQPHVLRRSGERFYGSPQHTLKARSTFVHHQGKARRVNRAIKAAT